MAVSFRAIDYDLKEGVQAFTNCKIYVDIDESGTYDPKIDIIINDPDNKDGYTTINLVGSCHINNFKGNKTPQIFIEDYEILNTIDYLF